MPVLKNRVPRHCHHTQSGHARVYINDQINRGRRMFKWAASQEYVPASVHVALTTVGGVLAHKTEMGACAARK
jgi:hypothetical protein